MYRIMSVDDEPMVIESIKGKIAFSQLDAEFAGSASNGREAMVRLSAVNPDIIIVDIRMPAMDGIGFARRIQQADYPAKVLISTAYSDFQYAREAIRLGVVDYLLKPIKAAELNRSLRACISQIDREKRGIELAFAQLVHPSPVQRRSAAEHLLGYRVFGECQAYLTILFEMYPVGEIKGTLHALKEMLTAQMLTRCRGIAVTPLSAHPNRYLAVAGCDYTRNTVMPSIQAVIDGLTEHYRCLCSVGDPVQSLEEIQPALHLLQEGLDTRPLGSAPIRNIYASPPPASTQTDEAAHHLLNIGYFAKKADADNILHETECLLQRAFQSHLPTQRSLLELCNRILAAVYSSVNDPRPLPVTYPDLMRLFGVPPASSDDAAQFLPAVGRYLREYIQGSLPQRSTLRGHIHETREYIRHNFAEDIKLRDFARRYFYSEEYFSKLFKAEFGEGFAEYLMRVRLEHALKLMENECVRLADVALLCGYHDYKYFCRLFRQRYGFPPSEMRKRQKGSFQR